MGSEDGLVRRVEIVWQTPEQGRMRVVDAGGSPCDGKSPGPRLRLAADGWCTLAESERPFSGTVRFPSLGNRAVYSWRALMLFVALWLYPEGLCYDDLKRLRGWRASDNPGKTFKDLLGHASITTTMRYLHLAPSTLQSAIDTLEAFNAAREESQPWALMGTAPPNSLVQQTGALELSRETSLGQRKILHEAGFVRWSG